ncbi:uncharacterized protein LOC117643884 [Thrips palmi]|uniref:Uncharacterized protein LOC117643884 n=1 Tax=Thrips palmi TaxID=161013 RepID=A0A6P8YPT1_THRPL|nr:uncharacterized protein LOC117643884 [Thrips palmi]
MLTVLLVALAAAAAASPVNYGAYYSGGYPTPAATRRASYAPPPVQLWFLSPADVAELISRVPLSNYREVPPNAPVAVASRYTPGEQHLLRKEEVDVSQFHTQDGAGRAVFGYSTPDQVRVEARSGDGRVRGSYSYRDPTGKIVKVNYWDDGDGFHVAGNTLPTENDVPEPVTETPEVAAARLQHEASYAHALQAAILSGNGDESDQTRVEGPSGDLPPVYDADGTELRRYPAPQHASLYDPSHLHDAERDAVIINNPDLEADSFNDVQLFRSVGSRARGYHPRVQHPRHGSGVRARRQLEQDQHDQQDEQNQQQDKKDGFFYSFHYPAPVLVGVQPPPSASDGRLGSAPAPDQQSLSLSQRAVFFGAIPVAAVHDAQVAPGQASARADAVEYARKPVYTEPQA